MEIFTKIFIFSYHFSLLKTFFLNLTTKIYLNEIVGTTSPKSI